MTQCPIRITLKGFEGLAQAIERDLAPHVTQAVKATAAHTQDVWRERVRQARGVWVVDRGRYIQSLQYRMKGPFAAEVGTDDTVAEQIEKGRPARDLKKMLNTSPKVRRTEKGRRFLVIPLRHNTPDHGALAPAMSKQAYQMALGLTKSRITSQSQRPSGQMVSLSPRAGGMRPSPLHTPFASDRRTRGELMVKQRHYAWGDRLTAQALREAGVSSSEVKRYAGMVRMRTSAGRAKSSAYLTFRVMAEGQSGWIVPAKPGLWIARDVAAAMQPAAQAIMERAAMLDIG